MKSDLDKMFKDLEKSVHNELSDPFYHVKVSQVKNYFYVLIRKKRGKVFGEKVKKGKNCLIRSELFQKTFIKIMQEIVPV